MCFVVGMNVICFVFLLVIFDEDIKEGFVCFECVVVVVVNVE